MVQKDCNRNSGPENTVSELKNSLERFKSRLIIKKRIDKRHDLKSSSQRRKNEEKKRRGYMRLSVQ